jgi:3-methyladenine DNA glycosylase Mpg
LTRKHNGADLCGRDVWIEQRDPPLNRAQIGTSPRIGISRGKDFAWRFVILGSPYLSR